MNEVDDIAARFGSLKIAIDGVLKQVLNFPKLIDMHAKK